MPFAFDVNPQNINKGYAISLRFFLIILFLISPIIFIMIERVKYNAIDAAFRILKNEPEKDFFENKKKFKFFLFSKIWYLMKMILTQLIFFGPIIYFFPVLHKLGNILIYSDPYVPIFWFNDNLFLTLILFLPALYILVRYYFTGFSILGKNTSVLEDIKITKNLTEGIEWKLVIFIMLPIIFNIIEPNLVSFFVINLFEFPIEFNTLDILSVWILLALFIFTTSSIFIIWQFAKTHIYMQLLNFENKQKIKN